MAKFSDIRHPEQKLRLKKAIRWEKRFGKLYHVLVFVALAYLIYRTF